MFNRGRTNPDLFPQVERIQGDRAHDLAKLGGRNWDVVVDTCGYFPRTVRLAAEVLKGHVGHYVFVSSISVYADFSKIGINESDAVGKLEDESLEEITDESYGPLKALCERAVQDVFGVSSLIIRPGLIAGPHDPTDRFTYWPVRVARGGDVLAPHEPGSPVQLIDVRDLCDFILELIEQTTSGVFNATGPASMLTMDALLDVCRQMSRSDAQFRWAPLEFLEDNRVQPWSDMPIWLPASGDNAGAARLDISKAMHAGLVFRPLESTVRDTLAWAATLPNDYTWKAGLTPEREKELLELLGQ